MSYRNLRCLASVCGVALALASAAAAAQPPRLLTVEQQGRYTKATFSAPGADVLDIDFAAKPGRATDGSFLEGNLEYTDLLEGDEIESGTWRDESIEPDTYYVMLKASDFDCADKPSCTEGYSNILKLVVPKPKPAHSGSLTGLPYSQIGSLTLQVLATVTGGAVAYLTWYLVDELLPAFEGFASG